MVRFDTFIMPHQPRVALLADMLDAEDISVVDADREGWLDIEGDGASMEIPEADSNLQQALRQTHKLLVRDDDGFPLIIDSDEEYLD